MDYVSDMAQRQPHILDVELILMDDVTTAIDTKSKILEIGKGAVDADIVVTTTAAVNFAVNLSEKADGTSPVSMQTIKCLGEGTHTFPFYNVSEGKVYPYLYITADGVATVTAFVGKK